MTDINYQEGLTPKQATISGIELIASRYGGYIYDVKFDNGWRCYVDPNNRNWWQWREICEHDRVGVTLGKLRAKRKSKQIYNADSPIVVIHDPMNDHTVDDRDNIIEIVRLPALNLLEMVWLGESIDCADDLPAVEVVQMPDRSLQLADEMHIKDERSLYIIPIELA